MLNGRCSLSYLEQMATGSDLASELNKSSPPSEVDHKSSIPDSVAEREAVRRLDWTILPVVTMFYLLSYLVCARHIYRSFCLHRPE